MTDLQKQLFSMQDLKYKDFHQKLMPTVDRDSVIGIPTPLLRKFSKEFFKTENVGAFIKNLSHKYYEENNLHAFLIEQIKDFDECIYELERFLPYVDNWATCDMMSPKIFKKHLPELENKIYTWLSANNIYTIRFGIKTLISLYLDEHFDTKHLDVISKIKSEEYYIKMAVAWYFSVALAKQYNHALSYIKNRALDTWTHNKTIQKAIESYRISDETKTYLRSFKIP